MYQSEENKIRAPKVKSNVFSRQIPVMATSLSQNLGHLHEVLGEVKGLAAKILKTNFVRECPNSLSNIPKLMNLNITHPTTNDVKKKEKQKKVGNPRQQMDEQFPVKVEKSQSKDSRKTSQKLFIEDIAEGTTDKELKSVLKNDSSTLTVNLNANIQATDQGFFVVTFFNQREKNFMTEATVNYIFSKFGPVAEIKYTENGRILISYQEKEGALKALQIMNMGTKYRVWTNNPVLNDEIRSLGLSQQSGPKNQPMTKVEEANIDESRMLIDEHVATPTNDETNSTTNMISNIQKTVTYPLLQMAQFKFHYFS